MTKVLPKDLTSYDFLKTLAVLLMVIDHIGYHFFPDEMWFRVLGRLSFPIWFFFVGHARSTELSPRLWGGIAILVASSLIAGQYLLPVTALLTILISRYLRHGIVIRSLHSPQALRGMFLILFFAGFPTGILFEYGTMGMLFVLMGYIMRHYEEVKKDIEEKYLLLFAGASFFVFYVTQGMTLTTATLSQAGVMFLGFSVLFYWLWNFRAKTYPDLTKKLPRVLIVPLQIMGRYTLEIYVAHLVLFRAIAMNIDFKRFGFLDWEIAPAGMISTFM
jgi:hypothetical protein